MSIMSKSCTQGYCKLLRTFTFNSQATLLWQPGGLRPGLAAIPACVTSATGSFLGTPISTDPLPPPPRALHINTSSQLEKSKFTLATTPNTKNHSCF